MSLRKRAVAFRFASCVAVISAALAAGSVSTLPASASPSVSEQSTAIITPLLTLFEFGDTVGLTEGCQTGLTTLAAVVAQAQASTQFSPIAAEIGTECQNLSNQGPTYIQQAINASQSGTALNGLLNPAIADGSNLLSTIGNNPGVQDSPVGPTIGGLGQTVTFFEGS